MDVKVLYRTKEYALAEVPLNLIDIPKERFRAVMDDRGRATLEATLKDLPLLNEVGLLEDQGRFQLIYGEGRIRELEGLKREKVRAKIWKVDEDTALYMQIAENAARGSYSKAQLLDYIIKLLPSKRIKQKSIAKMLNILPSELSKLKTIAEMSDHLKEVYISADVPVDTMYELRLLSNDAARENALNTILLQNQSKDVARHYIRHMLASLCDECGLTGSQRNDHSPLHFYGEEWICSTCFEKVKPEEVAEITMHSEPPKVAMEPIPRTIPPIKSQTCVICKREYASVEITIPYCHEDFVKMGLVYAQALQQLGMELISCNLDKIRGMKVSW